MAATPPNPKPETPSSTDFAPPSDSGGDTLVPITAQPPTRLDAAYRDPSGGELTLEPVVESEEEKSEQRPRSGPVTNASTQLRTIGGCVLGKKLGRGGMGTVYLAVQEKLHRQVAVKIIPAGKSDDKEDIERFDREAKLAGSLQHPNIVQVYDQGKEGNLAYIVMEYIDGGTLHHYISGQPMDVLQAALMLEQIARGMHYAHSKKIVHRDLKPGNILLVPVTEMKLGSLASLGDIDPTHQTYIVPISESKENQPPQAPQLKMIPKITDFGLAKDLSRSRYQEQLTATGIALGTPSYMAPEQARGETEKIGVSTDVYALGAILYEMLTGRPPFSGDNALQTMEQLCTKKPIPPSRLRPSIPGELERICLRCLEKTARKRFANAEELADALKRFIEREVLTERVSLSLKQWVRSSPPPAWLFIAFTVGIFVASLYLIWKSWSDTPESSQASRDLPEVVKAQNEKENAREWEPKIELLAAQIETGHRNCLQGDQPRGLKQFQNAIGSIDAELMSLGTNANPELQRIRDSLTNLRKVAQWNLAEWTPQKLRYVREVLANGIGFSFSRDGHWLATLDRTGKLELWNFKEEPTSREEAKSGPEHTVANFLPVEKSSPLRFAWSRDGEQLAVAWGSSFREYLITEKKTNGEHRDLFHHPIHDLIYSPSEPAIYFAGSDKKIRRFHRETRATQVRWEVDTPQFIDSMQFDRQGAFLTVATREGELHRYALTGNDPPDKQAILSGGVLASRRSERTNELFLTNPLGNWVKYQTETRRTIEGPSQGMLIERIGASHAGYVAMMGNANLGDAANTPPLGMIRFLDSMSLEDRIAPFRTSRRLWNLAVHPTRSFIAVGFDEHAVTVFDFPETNRSKQPLTLAQKSPGPLFRVQFSEDGKTLFLLGKEGGQRFVVETLTPSSTLIKPTFDILSGAMNPTTLDIAFGGADGAISLSPAVDSANPLTMSDGGKSRFTQVEFIPGESAIFGYSPPTQADANDDDPPSGTWLNSPSREWNLKTRKASPKLEGFPPVQQMLFGASKHQLFLASQDKKLRMIDLDNPTGGSSRVFPHNSPVTAVAWSASGNVVASGCDDGTISVWKPDAERPRWERLGHRQYISALAFSPDGTMLASGSTDGSMRLWDTGTGLPLGLTQHHGATIRSLAFDPKGSRFVSAGADGKAWIWSVRTWDSIAEVKK